MTIRTPPNVRNSSEPEASNGVLVPVTANGGVVRTGVSVVVGDIGGATGPFPLLAAAPGGGLLNGPGYGSGAVLNTDDTEQSLRTAAVNRSLPTTVTESASISVTETR